MEFYEPSLITDTLQQWLLITMQRFCTSKLPSSIQSRCPHFLTSPSITITAISLNNFTKSFCQRASKAMCYAMESPPSWIVSHGIQNSVLLPWLDTTQYSVAMGNPPSWIVIHWIQNSVPPCIAALTWYHSVLPWEIHHLGLSLMGPK